jgi:selenide,water dikinase
VNQPVPDLILVGGGHAHVEVLRRLAERPIPGVRPILISPDTHTAYSGMLPGLVAGVYGWEQCHIDLRPLCRRAGIEFWATRVDALDADARTVWCAGGQTRAFDVLSLDVGSSPDVEAVPGAAEHSVPVRPVPVLLDAWRAVAVQCGRQGRAPVRIAVVGGGAAGVEIAMAMRQRCQHDRGGPHARMTIVADTLLPRHGALARRLVARALAARGVTLLLRRRVVRVVPGEVHCATGEIVPADFVVRATAASPAAWIAATGLATDDHGWVAVNNSLQSVSHPSVFAAGDVASILKHPRPKAGVFAVRHGPVLAENLRRSLGGESLLTYRPQRHALAMLSTGDGVAIASYAGVAWQGRWVWRWKDRIDRAFMRKYA